MRVHYFADQAGLSEVQIHASVYGDANDPSWEPEDRVLVRLADELHDTASISDELWADLRAACSEQAILQMLMMAGQYRTVAYIANGLQLPLEPKVGRPFPGGNHE